MKIAFKHKASSLTNAIFICLIISIFCGCLVLIHHYNNLLNSKLEMQNQLVHRNNSAFTFFLNNTSKIEEDKGFDIFDDGIESYAEIKNWGFYKVLTCKSVFKTDTVSKTALIGKRSKKKEALALYVTNYDKPVKVSGRINISGMIKIPNGEIEQIYISNQNSNEIKLTGAQLKSDDVLPKIKSIEFNYYGESHIPSEVFNFEETIINDFENTTLIINYNELKELEGISLKGNIILKSETIITLTRKSSLEDVLIVAPKVIVEKGFRGSVQIIAEKEVVIGEDVFLSYPSSIYLKNDTDSVKVNVNKNSKIAGGIVITGETYNGSLKRSLIIEEGAKIIGVVFCNGKTQFNGEIIGALYTDKLFLKTKSSSYENVILNGIINREDLPEDFLGLPLFDNETNYEIIKTF
ncbi:hypothetical protein [Olleya sp. HaHaR_3_96]|uniref:hypothetical protein n=1 Tax=Olleya sp. HaHaR_3_96 TaxID=2745560 RepID=UPI001C4EAC2F|nr:hypothetical protein [Olleya sp. HaHaR_3_96]QXP58396.1 hypothetical protein H0I26_10740 [Olleya sp. HaHaR_3_96]